MKSEQKVSLGRHRRNCSICSHAQLPPGRFGLLTGLGARTLASARQESEAEDAWDKPLDCTGLAERMQAARERALLREERGEALEQWTPIYIPPGKENTVRGRLATRMNAARERVRQYEAG
jgi:hypothetical protein